jgi:hypothetical protein
MQMARGDLSLSGSSGRNSREILFEISRVSVSKCRDLQGVMPLSIMTSPSRPSAARFGGLLACNRKSGVKSDKVSSTATTFRSNCCCQAEGSKLVHKRNDCPKLGLRSRFFPERSYTNQGDSTSSIGTRRLFPST